MPRRRSARLAERAPKQAVISDLEPPSKKLRSKRDEPQNAAPDGGDNMASGGDVTGDLTAVPALSDASDRPPEGTATWLDMLPLEILEKVASWLDWRSRRSLKGVSAHCQDAVELLFGRLRAVRVVFGVHGTVCLFDTDKNRLWAYEEDGSLSGPAQLANMFADITSLLELHIVSHIVVGSERMLVSSWLKALSAASASWTRLERLNLSQLLISSDPSDLALLSELCANCPLLTDVSLNGDYFGRPTGGDEVVKTVVAARPGLRALHAHHDCEGSFLSELPTGLHELSIDSFHLQSAAVSQLARLCELRSLALKSTRGLRAEHLKSGLAGCISLERLVLSRLSLSVIDCLPAVGLPALRHLELEYCELTDTDMGHLVERLPGLESVCLDGNEKITEHGLAYLGRLPALRSVKVCSDSRYSIVSDETLVKLSSAPLVELELASDYGNFSVTAEGLLQLTRACPALRMVVLRSLCYGTVRQIKCGPGVDDRGLLQMFKDSLDEGKANFDDVYNECHHDDHWGDSEDSDYDYGFY